MSDTVTIRFSDEEIKIIREYAKLCRCSVSEIIKKLVFEKIDDEIDLHSIKEYEELKKKGKLKMHPIIKLWKDLGLND